MPKGRPIPNIIRHRNDAVTEIIVTRRDATQHVVLVDTRSYHIMIEGLRIYVGKIHQTRNDQFYARVMIAGTMWYLHRYLGLGILRLGMPEIDHINRNTLDNRRANLRPANRSQQMQNTRKQHPGDIQYV